MVKTVADILGKEIALKAEDEEKARLEQEARLAELKAMQFSGSAKASAKLFNKT